jgi:uncharacterized protein (TIGR02453 family)
MSAAPESIREFDPEFFDFLIELAANNDRDWFADNKARYETQVLEPALAFIEDFGYRLAEISPNLRADSRRNGGSLFRIYRDTRFSRDKTPYKTHTGMHFRHVAAKDVHAPGYYLHLAPDSVFAGAGIWRPETQTCNKIREAIVANPKGWRAATAGNDAFVARFGAVGGEQLKRVPSSFDPDHEFSEDLRRKGFTASVELDRQIATTPGFLDVYTGVCEDAAPMMRFLCRALDLEF